jgi:hypothetical protein
MLTPIVALLRATASALLPIEPRQPDARPPLPAATRPECLSKRRRLLLVRW